MKQEVLGQYFPEPRNKWDVKFHGLLFLLCGEAEAETLTSESNS